MKLKKWVFTGILYLSLPFLIYYLSKFDYLQFKDIEFNKPYFILAVLFLFVGFFFSTVSWGVALRAHNLKVSYKDAVISHGLSVFAKYIPGKVWVILGRASYVSKKGAKLSDASFISFKEQLLYILIGLVVSLIPSILFFNRNYWLLIIICTIVGLALLLFVPFIHDFFEKTASRILKKQVNYPLLEPKLALKMSGAIVLYWFFWGVAFYCLGNSITDSFSAIHAFAFPLAVCYGVLAIFFPGGIGVREGIMVAFMTASGLDMTYAVTISVISRLWFISGEVFIFLLAIVLKSLSKKG